MDKMQPSSDVLRTKDTSKGIANKKKNMDEAKGKQRATKEERLRLMEEKRQHKEVSLILLVLDLDLTGITYINQLMHMTAREVAKSSVES